MISTYFDHMQIAKSSIGRSDLPKIGGFSLIETAIVLGVVGLVIGGIWVAAAAVSENRKQARLLEQIAYTTQQIARVYAGQAGGTPFVFWDVGGRYRKPGWSAFLLADMITSAPLPVTPWGTTFGISVDPSVREVSYNIEVPAVNSCVSLAPRIYALLQSSLKLNGDGYFVSGGLGDISTPDLAAVNCAVSSGRPYIYFVATY